MMADAPIASAGAAVPIIHIMLPPATSRYLETVWLTHISTLPYPLFVHKFAIFVVKFEKFSDNDSLAFIFVW